MADFLLDTNILILHLRKYDKITALLLELSETSSLYISTVVRTEILAGMHPHEETRTMLLLNSLTSLPVDTPIADMAGCISFLGRILIGGRAGIPMPGPFSGA